MMIFWVMTMMGSHGFGRNSFSKLSAFIVKRNSFLNILIKNKVHNVLICSVIGKK